MNGIQFRSALLSGAALVALPALAFAQTAPAKADEIVVTGSRTITNGNNSPTPVTIVQADELLADTPTTVGEALDKLPEFTPGSPLVANGNPSGNTNANVLNLREFGAIRTLVLEDGRRVTPSAANGTVDTNTMPDMLLQRVDVVTGGASAAYGSDAVTGVVNYVLNHNFNGLKLDVEGGESSRRDDGSWKFGIAGGQSFVDGKLHVEASFQHYNSDGIPSKLSRTIGANTYCLTGAGTAANPDAFTAHCRNDTASFGGLITSGPGKGLEFASNGTLSPFVNGAATGSAAAQVGGDGIYITDSSLAASLKTDQFFLRSDYDFGNQIHGFIEGSWNRSISNDGFSNFGGANPLTYSTSNAFLSPAQQTQLSAGGATTFVMGKQFLNTNPIESNANTTDYTIVGGLDGKFDDRFDWNVYYTHGDTTLVETAVNNINTQKLSAAMDAVVNPANGQVVCNVTLTNPGLYPGCAPINPFGPSTTSAAALAYAQQNTYFTMNNYMDDVGGTVSGDVYSLPAGPLKTALTGEYREMRLTNASQFTPTQTDNCTGLRYNCTATTLLWNSNTAEPMSASEGIGEVALEANVPVLKNLPLAESFDLNGAVRYANYSISGGATTWKIGGDWHPTDELSIRGTRSQDIRAPTLYDLDAPVQVSLAGLNDSHTLTTGFVNVQSQGNPHLVPEVGQTYTVGFVYRPRWIPRFSVSLDYYDISLTNAITSVSGGTVTYDQLCDASGGSSPYCSLYVRPFGFSNTTPSNYPTTVLSQPLNIAKQWTHGLDIEANYNFRLEDVLKPLEGKVALRVLANYQPVLDSVTVPGTAPINGAGYANGYTGIGAGSVWKLTFMGSYTDGPFVVNVQERWRSSQLPNANTAIIYAANTSIPAVAYTDMTLTYNFKAGNANTAAFITVQNLFDQQPSPFVNNSANTINFYNDVTAGDDVIGRYITVGFRLKL